MIKYMKACNKTIERNPELRSLDNRILSQDGEASRAHWIT
jgi:hypothetical protein